MTALPVVPHAVLLDLLRQHGRNLHSFMVLEPGLTTWLSAERDAAVAYADHGGYWVAAGGPLCAPERSRAVVRAFSTAARRAGRRAAFFGVSPALVERLGDDPAVDAQLIGLAPVWRPREWGDTLRRAKKLRNRLAHAARVGLTTRRVASDELPRLQPTLTRVVDAWNASRALPPMGFMVTVELFQHAELRRYFLAEQAGQVVGFAVCVPVFGRGGWLLEDLMIEPGAPSGTSECLVDAAMRQLAAEDAAVVSLGMVALAGLERPEAAGRHPWLTGALRTCARGMGWLYDFDGLYRFRDKLRPAAWEPVYLLADGGVSWLTIRAVLMAFAGGWLPRFALRVVGRLRWWRR